MTELALRMIWQVATSRLPYVAIVRLRRFMYPVTTILGQLCRSAYFIRCCYAIKSLYMLPPLRTPLNSIVSDCLNNCSAISSRATANEFTRLPRASTERS